MKSILLLFFLLSPLPAFAYLDPGTGSYLLQFLLAGIFGMLFYIKLYWAKFKSFFYKAPAKPEENKTDTNPVKKAGSQ